MTSLFDLTGLSLIEVAGAGALGILAGLALGAIWFKR